MTNGKAPRPTSAHRYLPHLRDPIDAFTLAERAGSTYSGASSALRGMHRKGLVRKITQRKNGEFVAHHWQATK